MMSLQPPTITVIGASWCPDCRRTKSFLEEQRITYEWIDLNTHPKATALIEELNGGSRIIPTVVFRDGSHLAELGNDELADKLGLSRVASEPMYDLIIIGGGPTGITTSIYAARKTSSVLIIEKSAFGGQAGVTEHLDNNPAFPRASRAACDGPFYAAPRRSSSLAVETADSRRDYSSRNSRST